MSAAPTTSQRGGVVSRVRTLLALDGPLAATVLTVYRHFLLSVSFIGCLVPVLAFTALVGWQATHLAVWLGAAALLPLVPATYALLRGARSLLAERGDAPAGREFWTSFARGCRDLWWAALGLGVVVVVLQYDLALFGGADAVVLLAAAAAALAVVLLIGVCVVAAAQPVNAGVSSAGARAPSAQRPGVVGFRSLSERGTSETKRPDRTIDASAIDTVTAAAKAIARRPHIALSWLLLIGLGLAATALPLIGPAIALFLPATVGAGIHICNDALRLPLNDETRQTP
ncbi:hypothetical protein B1729_07570 [Microbacterium sp. B35-04]|uniref:hypothetical protein n=1 Tax=Microbacterium sp. B35-04 TaxID=1961716 RepID=UPI0013D110FA|nr:hypothetical protein [Microbacterium sp. B35-04]KAF2413911.1 hypothetical protein B1729_07570 [Microbacterium sp. B35-04]